MIVIAWHKNIHMRYMGTNSSRRLCEVKYTIFMFNEENVHSGTQLLSGVRKTLPRSTY